MSRGELEAKELQARRAYTAGPKDVSAHLKTPLRPKQTSGRQRSRPSSTATSRPRRPCAPSPTSLGRRGRSWKPTTPGTRTGLPLLASATGVCPSTFELLGDERAGIPDGASYSSPHPVQATLVSCQARGGYWTLPMPARVDV
jgi:hypothetical protein